MTATTTTKYPAILTLGDLTEIAAAHPRILGKIVKETTRLGQRLPHYGIEFSNRGHHDYTTPLREVLEDRYGTQVIPAIGGILESAGYCSYGVQARSIARIAADARAVMGGWTTQELLEANLRVTRDLQSLARKAALHTIDYGARKLRATILENCRAADLDLDWVVVALEELEDKLREAVK